MTKQEADEIKKILKSENVIHTPYFKSKTGELRIEVVCWNTSIGGSISEDLIKERTLNVLNALTKNGLKPKYRKDQIIYQGFLDCRYLVFE